MDQKLVYAFRGWIAFVALMDMGTAVRSYIEKRSFLGDAVTEDPILPRILGIYSILKALALIHCTLFIHYKPVVSLGICALIVSLFLYSSEVFFFHSTILSFYVIFHGVLNAITLGGLIILPRRFLETPTVNEDENAELLRQATVFKRRRPKKTT
ncbi:uncharacterized protein [Anabrus simplex]|uniref:uncharacterized protein n=1 Tax=Anabrus simplex TaxID=316456 RepID=UPI0034DD02ED